MGDRSKAWPQFRSEITGLVSDYCRRSDPIPLDRARRILTEVAAAEEHRAGVFGLCFDGWVDPSSGFRMSARALRRANPGFDVAIEKVVRHDAAQSLGSRNTRIGFHVTAAIRDRREADEFEFGVRGARGLHPLACSNPDTARQLRQTDPLSGMRFRVLAAAGTGRPRGFLDAISIVEIAGQRDPGEWLAGLLTLEPAALFTMLDHPQMAHVAAVVGVLCEEVMMDPEWADRFVVLAHGSTADISSGLTLMTVRRPDIDSGEPPADLIPMPELRQMGALIRAVDSETAIAHPGQTWLRLNDVLVQDGGTVFDGRELIAYEEAADPSLDFVAGHWDTIFGSQTRPEIALVRKRIVDPFTHAAGILLGGRNDSNWYHWLIEYLPRALQLDASMPDDVQFVVSERLPATGFQALQALSDRDIVQLDSTVAHRFGELHVLAPPVQILDTTQIPWNKGLKLNPEPLRAMRSIWGVDAQRSSGGDRVFLRRNSIRRGLLNEPELVEIATRHGLRIVDPGQLTWTEQLDLFSCSSLVVGASGAVMANYLLMREGCEVLAITSTPLADFVLPAAIARVGGVGFSYVLGPVSSKLTTHGNRNTWLHSNFTVSPRSFTRALRQTLDKLG